MVTRPHLPSRTRVATWLFLTPLVSLLNVWIRPAMYYAVFRARCTERHTRIRSTELVTTGGLATLPAPRGSAHDSPERANRD